MRELLKRWAELEPDRCRQKLAEMALEGFVFNLNDCWNLIHSKKANEADSLMRIQWAVQQAIVARGWRWNLECYPLTGICEGMILISLSYVLRRGDDPATALLTAYLAALENSTSLKEWESK